MGANPTAENPIPTTKLGYEKLAKKASHVLRKIGLNIQLQKDIQIEAGEKMTKGKKQCYARQFLPTVITHQQRMCHVNYMKTINLAGYLQKRSPTTSKGKGRLQYHNSK